MRRGGKRVEVRLSDRSATVDLPGDGPVSATLVLATSRITVARPGQPFVQIPLGRRTPVDGKLSFALGAAAQANGDVNTLVLLERAARYAAVTSPRPLPKLTARIVAGPGGPGFDAPAAIEVPTAPLDWRFEATALVHEYGHFILNQLNAEGPDGGDHDQDKSYPDRPTLAWNEGFSHAFAALVVGDRGRLDVDCKPAVNPAQIPARPTLASAADKRYAQFSEARVGGVVYNLVKRLGAGPAGFKRLLGALATYRRAGHSVWTARDLRDLTVQQFERSANDHALMDVVFRSQGLMWDRHIAVGVPSADAEHDKLHDAGDTLVVRVTGPGGFNCRTTTDIDPSAQARIDGSQVATGLKRADGGLSFSANDDCYLVSGTDTVDFQNPHNFGTDSAEIPFPYLAGQAHWQGEYTVRAKYVCTFRPDAQSPTCPSVIQVEVSDNNPGLVATTPAARQGIRFSLARGVETTIATFSAAGKCRVVTFDCSV
jgi:hypothetical protein